MIETMAITYNIIMMTITRTATAMVSISVIAVIAMKLREPQIYMDIPETVF